MTKYIIIAFLLIITGIVVWLGMQKGEINVKRSITIEKPVNEVWPNIYQLNQWQHWSPWLCIEPGATVSVTGEGSGSIQSWEGALVGKGEIEHKQIKDLRYIEQEIRFEKPYKATATVTWELEEKDSTTTISWGMQQKVPFFLRFMTKQLEAMMINDYDRGLKMLKEYALNKKVSSHVQIDGIVDFPGYEFFGKRAQCKMNEVGESMSAVMEELTKYSEENNIEFDKAFSIYHHFNFETNDCDYTSGVNIPQNSKYEKEGFYLGSIPATKAIKVTFKGDYENLPNGWMAIYSYQRTNKLKANKDIDPFEIYLNNPNEVVNKDEWVTEIYLPLK